MQIRDIMTIDVRTARPETTLAEAVQTMWERDCGFLPVVSTEGRVIGVITDRDVCVAVATRGRTADRIAVREVSDGALHACLADDPVTKALDTMREYRIRRLPVIDKQGHLQGVLSLNDIVLHAGRAKGAVSPDEVVSALQGICAHRPLQAVAGAA